MPGLIGPFPGDPLVAYSADGASRVAVQPGIPIFNPAYNAWMVFVKATGATFSGGDVVVCTGSNRYNNTVEVSSASTIPQVEVAGVRPTGAAALASANYGYIITNGPVSAAKILANSNVTAAEVLLMCGTAAGTLDVFTAATSLASVRQSIAVCAITQTAATTANVCDITLFKSCYV